MKILLYAGHGKKDPGALGIGNQHEADINLGIAIRAEKILRDAGYKVETLQSGDIGNPEEQLKYIKNHSPDCFISIHSNSSENPDTSGVEVIYRDENDYPLASCIYQNIAAVTGLKQRGIKADIRELAVLKDESVPSCLVEMGFLSNEEDYYYILRNLDLLAWCIASGISIWAGQR